MDERIRRQILLVRDSGLTNMFDLNGVQRVAFDEGFYDLVMFIEEHENAYIQFLLRGDVEANS